VGFGLLFYHFTNKIRPMVHSCIKGNCAFWTSSGLVKTKLLDEASSWPLLIFFKVLVKNYKTNRKNLNIILYKSVNHKVEPIGSLIYPFYWLRNKYSHIWNLDQFATIIVKPIKTGFTVTKHKTAFDTIASKYEKLKSKFS
jgi:hypothetical protein